MQQKRRVILLSAALHAALLVWAHFQDRWAEVPYTDIDYDVFTDAATLVWKGQSPYLRHTYRYTPLLAYLLVPNVFFALWGKLLFSAANIYAGALLVPHTGVPLAALWSLNPFAAQIATRGSADCLPVLLVVMCYAAVKQRRPLQAGLLFGAAVHLKIYPIIYGLPFVLYLGGEPLVRDLKGGRIVAVLRRTDLWVFATAAAGLFSLLFAWVWLQFGYQGVFESYIYHSTRIDHRHNFSAFFPLLYYLPVEGGAAALGAVTKFAFLVQFVPVAAIGFALWRELELALFLQTLAFVAFNRVITSQYFIWWLGLLPLALKNRRSNLVEPAAWRKFLWKLGFAVLLWVAAQAVWLHFAYQLEFRGQPTFVSLGVAGCLLLLAHMNIARVFLD